MIFKKKKKISPKAEEAEKIVEKENSQEDENLYERCYGVDKFGNPSQFLYMQHDTRDIEMITIKNIKPHILKNIIGLREQLCIYDVMEKFNKDYDEDFVYYISVYIMRFLTKAWNEGKDEVDISTICNKQFMCKEGVYTSECLKELFSFKELEDIVEVKFI